MHPLPGRPPGAVQRAMARPSRAAAAAASTRAPAAAPGVWTLPMVQKAAAVFAELPVLPGWDRGAIAERVAAWYRFVDVVAEGAVATDAAVLAGEIVRFGARFLDAHPEHVLVGGARWGVADVEAVARWFGGVRGAGGADVDARLLAFERVVRSGLVQPDARPLADALLETIDGWRAARGA
jgi:hypothetical protein